MKRPLILIVEDNIFLLENTTEFLELEGYEVVSAKNGRQGFEKAIEHIPDVIVCDILMPEMDGLTLLEILGRHARLKNIPLIFYSGRSEKSHIRKGLDAGAFDYIVKPSNLEDLILSIRKCLKDRKLSK